MINGIILKIDSTNSYVYDLKTHEIILCKAKGNLRKNKLKLLVGDYVEYEKIDNNTGNIISIKERKNEIYRPKMANVDQVFIVSALKEPTIGTLIIDKYLAFLEYVNIEPVLLFTKIDLLSEKDNDIIEKVNDYKKMDYKVIEMDNKKPNMNILKYIGNLLKDKISIFIGQTGAGKTTTLNNFLNIEDQQKTQEISKSLNRGKHTTTNVTIYNLDNNIFIADSPGFSSFELKDINKNDLAWSFKCFKKYMGMCKFSDCIHINEIGCKIKEEVHQGNIPNFFYEDYIKIQNEIKKEKW